MKPQRRLVSFGNSTVAIDTFDPRGMEVAEFLFGDIPAAGGPEPHVTFTIVPGVEPGEVTAYRDGRFLYDGDELGALANTLVGDVLYHLINKSVDGLCIHAAALDFAGRGLLIPGPTGAGKTTFAAWLTGRAGFDYVSDELVFIPTAARNLKGFTRPLNIKAPAWPIVERYFELTGTEDEILTCPQSSLVPYRLLKPENRLSEPELAMIILPQRRDDAEFNLESLTPAQAAMALMECLVNARNLPGHGFPEVVRLVRETPAYRLTYANFEQLGERIEELLTALPQRRAANS